MTERDDATPETRPAADASPPETKPTEAPPQEKPKLKYERFMDVELRVALVLEAERVEGTDKLMRLQLDVGEDRRQIVAGVAESYAPEELVGKRIVIVANLKPAKIRGVVSNGMLLAADLDGKPIVATFDRDVPPGTRVR
jgi:methionyl-tRNA synthetase